MRELGPAGIVPHPITLTWRLPMAMPNGTKSMTLGEGGLAIVFALLAFVSIFGAAKAMDAPFAFHAYLAAAASVAAVFAILSRYTARPAALPPAEIDGKPNYNMGPVKFATVMAIFWGITGFTVGLVIALQLAYPVLN